jgi:putative flippase GtrA
VKLFALFDLRFAKFLLVGVVNTIVGLSIIFAAKAFAHFNDVWANVAGYGVGLAVSFALNKQWTFRFSGGALAALVRFLVVFLVAYFANLGTVLGLIRLGVDSYWAQVLGIFPYTLLFYLGSRLYAFRRPAAATPGPAEEPSGRRQR